MAATQGSGILSKVSRILTGNEAANSFKRSVIASIDHEKAARLVIPPGRYWTTSELFVGQDESGLRLDRLITSRYDVPRPLLQKLLRKDMIKLERPDYAEEAGRIAQEMQIARIKATASLRVQPGDVVSLSEVFLAEKKNPSQLRLEDLTEERVRELHDMILYKDDNIIVLNKPSGLAVHGGPGVEEEHLEKFAAALQFDSPHPPRLVHRLDKDTSGLLILARTRKAASDLASRFQEASIEGRGIKKFYWAMVNGVPAVKSGRMITNIYKSDKERMTSIADNRIDVLDDGKVAITRFKNVGLYIRKTPTSRQKLSMLQLEPLTGRTHQLRVHTAEQLGCPILGDYKYGRNHAAHGPLHLHARKVVLQDYPEAGKEMSFKAPIPQHWVRTMTKFPLFLRTRPKFPKRKLHNLPNIKK